MVCLVKAMVFLVVMYGCESWTIKLSIKKFMALNCGVGEDSWEALQLQGNQTSQSRRKSVLNIHWKDWCWSWNSNTLATWCEELTGKDPDAVKDWRQEEKGMTQDEMVGWHHRLDGREFEWTLGVGDGQGGLVCCSPWGRKELDMTERLNWTELMNYLLPSSFDTFFLRKMYFPFLRKMNSQVHESFSMILSKYYFGIIFKMHFPFWSLN